MRDLIGYGLYSMIGLAGILLVFTLFSSSETDAQVDRLSTEMISLVNGVRKTHRGHPDRYGSAVITDEDLINAGVAPATTEIAGNTLQNAFGGDITVTGINNDTFRVIFSAIPREVCIQTLSQMRPDERVIDARVAATEATIGGQTPSEFPITFNDAADLCINNANAVALDAR